MNNFACIVNVKNNIENPQTVIIHGDDEAQSNKTSDNAPYAEFEEVADDDPLPVKGDTSDTLDTPDIITKLLPIFFGKREQAAKFLSDIRIMTPVQICAHVKQLVNDKVISNLSYQKDLWQVLHDHKLYNLGIRNWNKQVK